MKMRKETIILICHIGIGVVAFCLIYVLLLRYWLNTPISIPNADTVERIVMDYYPRGNGRRVSNGRVIKENPSDIAEILSILSEATRIRGSWLEAMNDEPLVPYPYIRISVHGGWARSFLYTSRGRGYFYFPYEGIYRISPDAIARIYEIYTAALVYAAEVQANP